MARSSRFRSLLRILPREFRAEFGDEMEATFAEAEEDARRAGGRRAVWMLWLRTAAGVFRLAPREHWDQLTQDVSYALRLMRRTPGVSIAAILTLSIAIGATTAMYSVTHAVLLRPLPYPSADRLVQVWETNRARGGTSTVSPVNFVEWRQSSDVMTAMGLYGYASLVLTGDGTPERVVSVPVDDGFFQVFTVTPALGRTFRADEFSHGPARAVVLSHAFWRSRFGGSVAVLGRTLVLDGEPAVVVGVMPESFQFPAAVVQAWTPMVPDTRPDRRGSHYLYGAGCLRDGVTLDQARTALNVVAARAERDHRGTNTDLRAELVPLKDEVVGDVGPRLVVLSAAVAVIFLIGCVNIANLLLARGLSRQRELAIRAAVGASRRRIVRQLVTESALLAAIGGALGVLVAGWLVHALLRLAGAELPRRQEVAVDGAALAFAIAVSALAALIFGLVPAATASKTDLQSATRIQSTTPGRASLRVRSALVVVEVALALALVAAGGLVARSFAALRHVDPGFVPARVLTAMVGLPARRYPDMSAQRRAWHDLITRVAALPGVEAAAATSELPLSGSRTTSSFSIEGEANSQTTPQSDYRQVTPGYFRTMGVPLVQGRAFTDADREGAAPVAIVNAAFAQKYLPGGPLGRRITISNPPVTREIVGIVATVRHDSLRSNPEPETYVPAAQDPAPRLMLAARVSGDAAALTETLGRAVREIDPDLALYSVRTMEDRMSQSLAVDTLTAAVMTLFAAVALLLAALGLHAVLAWNVLQRMHELGVRAAFGARRHDLVMLVLRDVVKLMTIGSFAGLAALGVASNSVGRVLFATSPHDLRVLAGAVLVLAVVAAAACVRPALRAGRADPLAMLRQ